MTLTTASAGALVRGSLGASQGEAPGDACAAPLRKGWFAIPGVQDGDRTLEEQLIGLDALAPAMKGRSVLDLGCAEGLILKHCVESWGASCGVGVSIVASEIAAGRQLCAGLPISLHVCDLNAALDYERLEQWGGLYEELWLSSAEHGLTGRPRFAPFGVVLALSILHKLADPPWLMDDIDRLTARDGVVAIRLPSPIIHDARSRFVAFDVREAMQKRGFVLGAEPATCRGEWLGVYRRAG